MIAAAKRMLKSQLVLWLIFAGVCLYLILPLRERIRLGMDLAGGTYLTLEVHTEKAIEAELINEMRAIEAKLQSTHHQLPATRNVTDNKIVLMYNDVIAAQDGALFLRDEFRTLEIIQEDARVIVTFTKAKMDDIEDNAVNRNQDVLRSRLDPYGTAEIPVARQGKKNLIIELPDVAKTAETKKRIGSSAQLDFRIVEKSAMNEDDLLIDYDGDLPADKEILPSRAKPGMSVQYYLVPKYADVTGRDLKTVAAGVGGEFQREPAVNFTLTAEGADKFYAMTSKNIGRYVAIILDGEVISYGHIKSAIRDTGSISGGFKDSKETRELAIMLQAGSYVAPVTIEEERQIGPSLGYESIQKGIMSCLVGMGLLLLFGLMYYRLAGLFAVFALMFNLLLILCGLSWLKATLTLPGIAGMVLTVGMAIDASILIYERIRELLRSGVALRQAVDEGFSDAMAVILDANITTFIVGVVLYYTGTGPIQGFAVTMMLGIIATLITGLFFLRSLFSFVLDNFRVQKLGI